MRVDSVRRRLAIFAMGSSTGTIAIVAATGDGAGAGAATVMGRTRNIAGARIHLMRNRKTPSGTR